VQGEDVSVEEQSKALTILKRLIVAWPVLALPFIPAIGKAVGGFVFLTVVAHAALQ
jgi:hypothetical protein